MILTNCRKEPSKTKGWRCRNLLLHEEKAAPQLRTHLGNLLAAESVKPLQTHRENLGRAMDRKSLGDGNPLVTP